MNSILAKFVDARTQFKERRKSWITKHELLVIDNMPQPALPDVRVGPVSPQQMKQDAPRRIQAEAERLAADLLLKGDFFLLFFFFLFFCVSCFNWWFVFQMQGKKRPKSAEISCSKSWELIKIDKFYLYAKIIFKIKYSFTIQSLKEMCA